MNMPINEEMPRNYANNNQPTPPHRGITLDHQPGLVGT